MPQKPATARPLHLVGDASLDVSALVRDAVAGAPAAQAELFRRYVQFVGAVARAAGAERDLEDVVQDTFIEAFASLSSLGDASSLRAWLARLTVRQVHRRLRWRPWLTLFETPSSEGEAWERWVDESVLPDERARVREVHRALSKTSDSARLCFLLRHWHGMTLEETAVATGLSLATVKRRLQQADDALLPLRKDAAR